MSHRGSVLALPSGIYGWDAVRFEDVGLDNLGRVFEDADAIEVLLVGCGPDLRVVPKPVREALREAGVVLEQMATSAAVRTYNVLLAEDRQVAAALIAVDDAR